jgi:hypothetical protein
MKEVMGRIKDYESLTKNDATKSCLTCYRNTFFKDQICGWCRSEVPEYIPTAQVKRYVFRTKKGIIHYA